MHVDRVRRELERISGAAHGDQVAVAQGSAQLRCEALKTVADLGRRRFAPQRIDELLGRNDATRLERQNRQEGAQLRACDRDVTPRVIENFEATQQTDLHGTHRTGDAATSASGQHLLSRPAEPAFMNAIDAALLAVEAAHDGEQATALEHLAQAQRQARTAPRRERQIVQIAALVVSGEHRRAAGLTLEHLAEFAEDAERLSCVVKREP